MASLLLWQVDGVELDRVPPHHLPFLRLRDALEVALDHFLEVRPRGDGTGTIRRPHDIADADEFSGSHSDRVVGEDGVALPYASFSIPIIPQ
jgi:hypothetical protein